MVKDSRFFSRRQKTEVRMGVKQEVTIEVKREVKMAFLSPSRGGARRAGEF